MCWEFGGGNGHVRRLKLIGERLQALGFEIVYGLRRPDVGSAIGIPEAVTRAAPNWPLRPVPPDVRKTMTSATYGDFLAQQLLGPYDDLGERFQLWHALIEAERPDLIIADYAPSISLLYYGRVPIVNIGNGYVLPPATLSAFPLLIEDVSIRFEESEVVERINSALHSFNKCPISHYPQINRADQSYLLTLPCLDPYRDQRKDGWLGSPDLKAIGRRTQPSQTIFVYFHEQHQTDARLIEGLVRAGLPGKAIFSTPLRRTVKQLAAAKIRAPGGLAHLPAELSNCGVLVHLGSCGMAMAGIAAGVPQVMIKTDLEKTLIARAITAREAGMVLSWSRFEAPELASAIRNAVESEAMQKAARDLSLENAPYLRIDPVDEITKGIMRILGG